MCAGLYHLETEDIVHGDVKPANVLVNTNAVLKWCDFGVCGHLSDVKSVSMGTPAYMPPRWEKLSIENDMWALGVTLIEIINGQHPLRQRDPEKLSLEILQWEPKVSTEVSDDIRGLVSNL